MVERGVPVAGGGRNSGYSIEGGEKRGRAVQVGRPRGIGAAHSVLRLQDRGSRAGICWLEGVRGGGLDQQWDGAGRGRCEQSRKHHSSNL